MEGKQDLRVIKTHQAIRKAFSDMICEMDYGQISIKELAARAQINRKTFYLHYESIDKLLEELQDEIVAGYTKQAISYSSMKDIRKIIRYYFESMAKASKLNETLMCNGSYRHISDRINELIMKHRKKVNQGVFGLDREKESLVFAYFGSVSAILYRQWVADGKKLPLEELIAMATKLICSGMESVVK
ncbi:MAG: TetR/AcrR family transcriptional regulator [Spirochaetia bacterium]|nr:TetR/AcrR family transcriptional regulator [Spirochaetia bacterium]